VAGPGRKQGITPETKEIRPEGTAKSRALEEKWEKLERKKLRG